MGNLAKAGLALLCFNLMACAKKADDNGPDPLHEKLTGSIVAAVTDVQAGQYTDACDERFAQDRMEIARALDARAGGIQRLASGLGEAAMSAPEFAIETPSRRVGIAGTYFIERDFSPGENSWKIQEKSWNVLIQRYHAIRNSPVNVHWVNLDANVRGLLVDDINRAIRGMDTGLDHTAQKPLADFMSVLAECRWLDCRKETLSPEIQSALTRNTRLNDLWLSYLNAKNEKEARDDLDAVIDRLQDDLSRYGFTNNPLVRREGLELVLPLAAADFVGYEEQLAAYIEPVWESSNQKLRIEWKTDASKPLFQMLLDRFHPYSRAFVNWGKKIVQLYPGTDTRAVAHEIGHVLGFRDVYYTLWDRDTCSYQVEYNEGDLMSSHRGGVVTADEWQKLFEMY